MATRGGKKLKKFLRDAKNAQGVRTVEVGFFSTAKYPDGTPVTNVAAWNEFGTENEDGSVHIPERPFFRNAVRAAPPELRAAVRDDINPRTMRVTRRTAKKAGLVMQTIIQRSITNLRDPENAPSTVAKKSSSNPLIDVAFMRLAVTFAIGKQGGGSAPSAGRRVT